MSKNRSAVNHNDHLLKNVQDLRKRLQVTQRNLQQITAWEGETSSGGQSFSDGGMKFSSPRRFSASTPLPSRMPRGLNLEDLTPDQHQHDVPPRYITREPVDDDSMSLHSTHTSLGASMIEQSKKKYQHNKDQYGHHAASNSDLDCSTDLRRKLQSLRQENSGLISDNHKLQSRIEDLDFELVRCESRMKDLIAQVEFAVKEKKEMTSLKNRVEDLQAEAETQDKTLREAESRYENLQRLLESTRHEHQYSMNEKSDLEQQLQKQIQLHEKSEKQLKTALHSLDSIKREFNDYQTKVKEKIKKMHLKEKSNAEQMTEKDNLICKLTGRVESLTSEVNDMKEEVSRQSVEISKTIDANDQYQQISSDLRSLVESQKSQIATLRSQKGESSAREAEFQELVTKQKSRMEQYQQDITASRHQLVQLEQMLEKAGLSLSLKSRPGSANSIGADSGVLSHSNQSQRDSPHHLISSGQSTRDALSRDQSFSSDVISPEHLDGDAQIAELRFQLAKKDAEIISLRAAQAGDENSNSSANFDRNNSHAASRRVAELENHVTRLEEERTNHKLRISQLETRVSDLDNEVSGKGTMLRHRNNDLSELQNELSNKHTEMMSMEKELRRKGNQVCTLERQLADKTNEFTDHYSTIQQLRDELANKTTALGALRGELDEKTHKLIQQRSMSEDVQSLHKQQCHEYQVQIDTLHTKLEEKLNDIKRAESVVISCKQEIDLKEEMLKTTQDQLNQSRQALDQRDHRDQVALQELESLSSQSSQQLHQMEAALAVCRQEIEMYVQELTQQKQLHHKQLDEKQADIHELELRLGDVESRHRVLAAKHAELESAYDRQEAMLASSSARVHELEESQNSLQHQLSFREKELSSSQLENTEQLLNVRNKLDQSLQDLNDRAKHNQQLMQLVQDLQTEKTQLNEKIEELKQDTEQLRSQCSDKDLAIKELEDAAAEIRREKERKAEQVYDLEERLHKMEAECDKYKNKAHTLDDDLHKLHAEVRATHDQLSQLKSLLTQSQEQVSSQVCEISSLQESLRESKSELLQRSQVCDELDQALKDRTWELEQRVSQLGELDLTFKESRDDAENQIATLESLLSQRQDDLEKRVKEITDLVVRVEELQRSTQLKDLDIERYQFSVQSLHEQMATKDRKLAEVEEECQQKRKELEEEKASNRELQQELRLTREQHQREHDDMLQAKRECSQSQRDSDVISRELDETRSLAERREFDSARLAEELGHMRAKHAQIESRSQAEARKLRQELALLRDQHQLELNNLRDDHNAIVHSKDSLANEHRVRVKELEETVNDLTRCVGELKERNTELEARLIEQQDMVHAAAHSMRRKQAALECLEDELCSLDQQRHLPSDGADRLASVYSGERPRTTSPDDRSCRRESDLRRISDISKITDYAELPYFTDTDRLQYLDIDDRRLSFNTKLFPPNSPSRRKPFRSSSIGSGRRSNSCHRRESRSDVSGIFTASESDGEADDNDDPDSFVVMLREVNKRFTKNRQDSRDLNQNTVTGNSMFEDTNMSDTNSICGSETSGTSASTVRGSGKMIKPVTAGSKVTAGSSEVIRIPSNAYDLDECGSDSTDTHTLT